ncbi:uncharacterized protein LOC124982646 [Sciurus carolinensis]|uniref:uncharacterized protein LOC124982646 n=1 Tax=Sciurus carolinensis TaxID=30640 RepID=UPI001FB24A05|nr:uncharacterized protein LOC124982646 [Sciurus carolinensis]
MPTLILVKCLGSLRACKLGRRRRRRAAAGAAGSGPRSRSIRNSDRAAQAGPRAASGRARCTAATASSGSASPRAPGAQCHGGARNGAARGRSNLGLPGRSATAGAVLRRLRTVRWSGGSGARPPPLRAGAPAQALLRRHLALQSRGPLATSFFHSQKRKGKKKKKKTGKVKKGDEGEKKIAPRNGSCDRDRPPWRAASATCPQGDNSVSIPVPPLEFSWHLWAFLSPPSLQLQPEPLMATAHTPESYLGTFWTLDSILPAAQDNLMEAPGSRIWYLTLIFAQPSNARIWKTGPYLRLGFLASKQGVINDPLRAIPCPAVSSSSRHSTELQVIPRRPPQKPAKEMHDMQRRCRSGPHLLGWISQDRTHHQPSWYLALQRCMEENGVQAPGAELGTDVHPCREVDAELRTRKLAAGRNQSQRLSPVVLTAGHLPGLRGWEEAT